MKLYMANGRYVGTQADAKKIDRNYAQAEVPTDKDGLICYLNALTRVTAEETKFNIEHDRDPVDMINAGPIMLTEHGFKPLDVAELNKSEPNRTLDLIAVEEFIQAADHRALASLASNVIWRMKELGGLA